MQTAAKLHDETLAPVAPPDSKRDVSTNEPWLVEFRDGEVVSRRLADVRSVSFNRTALKGGDDLYVVFDLFAKGKTEDLVYDEDNTKRLLRRLKVRVESDFVRNGSSTLAMSEPQAAENDDKADSCLVYWSLSQSVNKTGRRSMDDSNTLRFFVGNKRVGSFRLKWTNDG